MAHLGHSHQSTTFISLFFDVLAAERVFFITPNLVYHRKKYRLLLKYNEKFFFRKLCDAYNELLISNRTSNKIIFTLFWKNKQSVFCVKIFSRIDQYWCWLTSELVKQFCGSSRFLRRFRGANSVWGESCGGGGIADASWNKFDASPSDWSFFVSSCCVNDCVSISEMHICLFFLIDFFSLNYVFQGIFGNSMDSFRW